MRVIRWHILPLALLLDLPNDSTFSPAIHFIWSLRSLDLTNELSLATDTLQLDISITSLQQLNQVDAGVKKSTDSSQVSSTKILDSISNVHLSQKQEKDRALSSEEQGVINWLCHLEFSSKHSDALSRRQEGTGGWLLESSEFLSWLGTTGLERRSSLDWTRDMLHDAWTRSQGTLCLDESCGLENEVIA